MVVKKLRLLSIYGKDFLFYAALITLLTYFIFFNTGIHALNIIIWFKIITSALGAFIHQKRKAKELYFYMNNGLGKRELMVAAAAIDALVWGIGLAILVNAKL
ncbi:MAG: hypothetical protein AAFP77_19060 [Bacteroidota bacterium]